MTVGLEVRYRAPDERGGQGPHRRRERGDLAAHLTPRHRPGVRVRDLPITRAAIVGAIDMYA